MNQLNKGSFKRLFYLFIYIEYIYRYIIEYNYLTIDAEIDLGFIINRIISFI